MEKADEIKVKKIFKLSKPKFRISSISKGIRTINGDAHKKYIINCPHTEALHYAKGMCNYCYHTKARINAVTKCQHTNEKAYAKGLCRLCYNRKIFKANYVKKPRIHYYK